uniref:Uncharacterized protein n=1 Tax=Bursaphelenchus xylophilus TaxID=6326 RepID=A0A1I7SEZ9_BURXY
MSSPAKSDAVTNTTKTPSASTAAVPVVAVGVASATAAVPVVGEGPTELMSNVQNYGFKHLHAPPESLQEPNPGRRWIIFLIVAGPATDGIT